MLIALFALSALVLIATLLRRPRRVWERLIAAAAALLMLATLVAMALEYVAQRA
jgi:hypothetical protein